MKISINYTNKHKIVTLYDVYHITTISNTNAIFIIFTSEKECNKAISVLKTDQILFTYYSDLKDKILLNFKDTQISILT